MAAEFPIVFVLYPRVTQSASAALAMQPSSEPRRALPETPIG
jgi:hypothetical protein